MEECKEQEQNSHSQTYVLNTVFWIESYSWVSSNQTPRQYPAKLFLQHRDPGDFTEYRTDRTLGTLLGEGAE